MNIPAVTCLNAILSISRKLSPLHFYFLPFLIKPGLTLAKQPANSRQPAEPRRGQSVDPNCGACVVTGLWGAFAVASFFSSSLLFNDAVVSASYPISACKGWILEPRHVYTQLVRRGMLYFSFYLLI